MGILLESNSQRSSQFIKMNVEQSREQAQDENTPSSILAELAQHEDYQTRKLVAGNPNVFVVTLEELALEFTEAVIDNPIFTLLILEKPDSKFVKLALARSLTTKPETLARLSETKDQDILNEIARNLNTAASTLEKLANIPYQSTKYDVALEVKIHMGVAVNPSTPLYLIEKLANHDEPYVKQEIAKNPNTTTEILAGLINRNSEYLFPYIVQNPNSCSSILEKIALHFPNEEIRQAIIEHPLVSDQTIDILNCLGGKPGISESVFNSLVSISIRKVDQVLAFHPETPANILLKLAKDRHFIPEIYDNISVHPHVTPNILKEIALTLVQRGTLVTKKNESAPGYGIAKSYFSSIENSQIPLDIRLQLVKLIQQEKPEELQVLVQSKSLPPDIKQLLVEVSGEVVNR